VLLWANRKELAAVTFPGTWWGLPVLLFGAALHLVGGRYYYEWVEIVALLPSLAGLCLCLGGVRLLRCAWPAVVYLIFMVPLPYRLEVALSHPLQRLATLGSTYALQTLGVPAVAEGNIILLSETRIGVVEACNGLGMLVTFFALTTFVTFFLNRGWPEKVFVVLSAVPVGLVANLIRITVTGVLAETVSAEAADYLFHDLAGW